MARKEGLDSLYDESYGQPITQQVSTSQPRVEGTESLNLGVGGNQEIPGDFIITGMPDSGRVKLTPEGQYLYGSASFSGGAPQQLEDIVKATYGTSDPMQVRQMFQRFGAKPYGQAQMQENQMRDPESVGDLRPTAPNLGEQAESQFARDILQQVPEEELLAQQYMKGKLAVGSAVDEGYALFMDDPKKKFQYEQLIKHYEKEFPERAIPTQVVGAITSLVEGGQALKLAGGLKGVQKTIQRAKEWYNSLPDLGKKAVEVGGITSATGLEGFIYGFFEGNSEEERYGNAYNRAMTNVLTTTPITIAFPFVRNILSKPKLPSQKADAIAEEFGVSIGAAELIRDAYESGLSLEQMLSNIKSSGDQRMIAEANEGYKFILDNVASMSGKSSEVVQDEIAKRIGSQAGDIKRLSDQYFGVKPELRQSIINDIDKEFGDQATGLYKQAYDSGIDWSKTSGDDILESLSRMPKDLFDKVITSANKLAVSEKGSQYVFTPIRSKVNKDGFLELLDEPNLFQLDMIKRQLDEIVEDARDPLTKRISNDDGRVANNVVGDLRNALKNNNQFYKNALSVSQGRFKTEGALRFGDKFLKGNTTFDDVVDALNGASASEISAMRKSVRNQIDLMMDNVKVAAGKGTEQEVSATAKVLMEVLTPSNQKKLTELLGEKQAKAYFKKLTEAKKSFELQSRTRLGSPTAQRQYFKEMAEEGVERGLIGQVFDLNPKKAVQQLQRLIAGNPDEALKGRLGDVYTELAGFLVKIKGDKADAALNYLEKVRNGEKLGKAQQSYLVNLIKPLFSPSSEILLGTQAGNLNLENLSP